VGIKFLPALKEVQLSGEVETPVTLASTRKRKNHNLDKKITEVNGRESLKAKFRRPRSSSVNRDRHIYDEIAAVKENMSSENAMKSKARIQHSFGE